MTTPQRDALIADVASALAAGYSTRVPIAPPRDTLPGLSVDEAYEIQQRQERARRNAGETVIGRKIGLTSLAMQQQLGVDEPDFGFVTDALNVAPGEVIPADRFISPKVEPELAFVLNRDLTGGESLDEVASAIESVHKAIEIIDSRVANWDIRLVDTIADNASCGAIVVDPEPLEIDLGSLTSVPCSLEIDGEETGRGVGADVMGHPLEPLRWLAGVLAAKGVTLRAGEVVLTGAFCAAAAVSAGSTATADYGPYGRFSVSFS